MTFIYTLSWSGQRDSKRLMNRSDKMSFSFTCIWMAASWQNTFSYPSCTKLFLGTERLQDAELQFYHYPSAFCQNYPIFRTTQDASIKHFLLICPFPFIFYSYELYLPLKPCPIFFSALIYQTCILVIYQTCILVSWFFFEEVGYNSRQCTSLCTFPTTTALRSREVG